MEKYPKRFVAFIDVLGFRALVEDLNASRLEAADLRAILSSVRRRAKSKNKNFLVTNISDSFVLSCSIKAEALSDMFYAIQRLATGLLNRGVLIRGAVVKGRLIHDEEVVFGEGL